MSKDKIKFVIKYGILAWGVPLAVIWSFILSLNSSISLEDFLRHFLYAIIVFPIGGLLFGLFLLFTLPQKNPHPKNVSIYFAFLSGVLFIIIMILLSIYLK